MFSFGRWWQTANAAVPVIEWVAEDKQGAWRVWGAGMWGVGMWGLGSGLGSGSGCCPVPAFAIQQQPVIHVFAPRTTSRMVASC
jgi:hypothetical protein